MDWLVKCSFLQVETVKIIRSNTSVCVNCVFYSVVVRTER